MRPRKALTISALAPRLNSDRVSCALEDLAR
jgi:hypothetical protein